MLDVYSHDWRDEWVDPVFTLHWPEFLMAELLQRMLPKSDGYSILIPASRQEKGFDLALLKRTDQINRVATIQVKASRTYSDQPRIVNGRRRFTHTMRFNTFKVPEAADFFLLCGLFPPELSRTKPISVRWYRECTLLLTPREMRDLLDSCKTRGGKCESMFYFGFDHRNEVFQTRGIQDGSHLDCSSFVLERRIALIKTALCPPGRV